MNDVLRDHAIELATERLLLRPLAVSDAEEICQAVCESRAELMPWLPWCHAEYSIADTLAFLETRGRAHQQTGEHAFAVFERSSGRFCGATGLNLFDAVSKRANLGYWFRTSATGRGYATESTLAVARFGFEQLDLERIEIVAAVGNARSQRVAERAGAMREGIARRRLRVGDVQHNAVVYSLIRADLGPR